jgi:hypothetical protein
VNKQDDKWTEEERADAVATALNDAGLSAFSQDTGEESTALCFLARVAVKSSGAQRTLPGVLQSQTGMISQFPPFQPNARATL